MTSSEFSTSPQSCMHDNDSSNIKKNNKDKESSNNSRSSAKEAQQQQQQQQQGDPHESTGQALQQQKKEIYSGRKIDHNHEDLKHKPKEQQVEDCSDSVVSSPSLATSEQKEEKEDQEEEAQQQQHTTSNIPPRPLQTKKRQKYFTLKDHERPRQELIDAFQHRLSDKELLLVTGPSGTGKSCLVHHTIKSLINDNGILLIGKFNHHSSSEPYHAFCVAFSDWINKVISYGKLDVIKKAIRDANNASKKSNASLTGGGSGIDSNQSNDERSHQNTSDDNSSNLTQQLAQQQQQQQQQLQPLQCSELTREDVQVLLQSVPPLQPLLNGILLADYDEDEDDDILSQPFVDFSESFSSLSEEDDGDGSLGGFDSRQSKHLRRFSTALKIFSVSRASASSALSGRGSSHKSSSHHRRRHSYSGQHHQYQSNRHGHRRTSHSTPTGMTRRPSSAASSSTCLFDQQRVFCDAMTKWINLLSISTLGPVVLVVDDVQWADASSLQALESLIIGKVPSKSQYLVVATSRISKSVYLKDDWSRTISNLETKQAKVTNIPMYTLQHEAIHELVCTVMGENGNDESQAALADSETANPDFKELADQIYDNTDGSILFVLQYLQNLAGGNGKLGMDGDNDEIRPATTRRRSRRSSIRRVYSPNNRPSRSPPPPPSATMRPDLSPGVRSIKSTKSTRSNLSSSQHHSRQHIVEFITQNRMRILPIGVQEVLRTAAGLGSNEFDVRLLSKLLSYENVLPALLTAQENRLVELLNNLKTCRFTHDRIQESAYSLIPSEDRAAFHLDTARRLYQLLLLLPTNSDSMEFVTEIDIYHEEFEGVEENLLPFHMVEDSHIFLVVNQFVKGGVVRMKGNDKERDRVAKLCLYAARKAMDSSGFSNACTYVTYGIQLLQGRWDANADVSLEMYQIGTNLEFWRGRHDKVDKYHAVIVENAQQLEDTLPSYLTHISSLGTRGDAEVAIDEGFELLRLLGEGIPRNAVLLRTIQEVLSMKRKLAKCKDEILQLPKAVDARVLAALQVMHALYPFIFLRGSKFGPLVSMRIISLTLQNGLNPWSSMGFATFAIALVFMFPDEVEQNYELGKLALRVLNETSAHYKDVAPRVHCGLYGLVFPEKDSLFDMLEPLWSSYEFGLNGDVEAAFYSGNVHFHILSFCGKPMDITITRGRKYLQACVDRGQTLARVGCAISIQFCLNMSGQDESCTDPFVLTGEAMDEELTFEKYDDQQTFIGLILVKKFMIAVYLNSPGLAEKAEGGLTKMIKKRLGTGALLSFVSKTHDFHRGLVATSLIHSSIEKQTISASKRKKRLQLAKKCLTKLIKYAEQCPCTFLHKMHLLQAEIYSVKEKHREALEHYKLSVDHAEEAGFVNEQALACEKAGLALLRMDKHRMVVEACAYFDRSRELYEQWGSRLKANQLESFVSMARNPVSRIT